MGNCHSNAWGKELFKQEKGSIAKGGASPLVLGLKVQGSHFLDTNCAGLSKIKGTFQKNGRFICRRRELLVCALFRRELKKTNLMKVDLTLK